MKVHLVVALNEDTLRNLDAYVTLQGGEEMAHLETMPDRLHCITYTQMLSYIKQSNLMDLAKQGRGHTAHDEKRCTGATNQVGYGLFNAGIMTVVPRGSALAKRNRKPGKGAKAKQATKWLAIVSAKGKGNAAYPLVQVPPHADHLKAYTAGLATA